MRPRLIASENRLPGTGQCRAAGNASMRPRLIASENTLDQAGTWRLQALQ